MSLSRNDALFVGTDGNPIGVRGHGGRPCCDDRYSMLTLAQETAETFVAA